MESVRSSAGLEQRPSKPWVAGSSPAGQANLKKMKKSENNPLQFTKSVL
tara:strand:- start:225 stop:371 length:147 start_codon:yes stop_codon:yes gene_type:complete